MSSTISRFSGANSTSSSESIHHASLFNPVTKSPFLKNKKSAWNLHGRSYRSLQYLSMSMNLQTPTFVTQSNVNPPPEPPLPSGSPSGSLYGFNIPFTNKRNWIVGIVLTFILPFFTHKWGSLLQLKNQVNQKIEATEQIVKAVESLAERADKVIDGITDNLPEGSQLKRALEKADAIAEGVAKTAHLADDLINKVEEVEDELESLIHDENSKAEEIPREPKDKEETTAQEQNEK